MQGFCSSGSISSLMKRQYLPVRAEKLKKKVS
jgi:hypothetical protein